MLNQKSYIQNVSAILRGDPDSIHSAIRGETPGWALTSSLTILIGCALYGAAVGLWRAPEQAAFLAVKMPLLIFATLLFNGVLNGMLAQVLGTGLSFRQTFLAILMSFATFAAVLGALSPVALFMAIDAPVPDPVRPYSYWGFVLIHTGVIAYAGLVANLQMLGTLFQVAHRKAAILTFFAWTAGNLFVGAQLAWNLRPFFGLPSAKVEFLRVDAFEGSFYEAIATMVTRQFTRAGGPGIIFAAIVAITIAAVVFLFTNALSKNTNPTSQTQP